jgi:homoserine O-acetyltransferase/O-succinyltransferase
MLLCQQVVPPGYLLAFFHLDSAQLTQYFTYPHPFALENGETLPGFTLAYEVGGAFDRADKPLVWVCHALTGHARVPEWWPGLFETSGLFPPSEYGWICANMLGSCYGSTHALSLDPATQQPWFHRFPLLTNRDMVRAFDLLRQHLGRERVDVLMGGSMGGQQALEWAVQAPALFRCLIPIATNARHSSWGIAFNETQRMAIEADPTWQEDHPEAGLRGLQTARAIAMLSYRAYQTYALKQTEPDNEKLQAFRASSYQRYQGQKLVQRFNAFTYWTLSQAMDSHHLGRGRNGVAQALAQITARTLVVGVNSDGLFPLQEQRFIAQHIPRARLAVLRSDYGHDGFLVEMDQLRHIIGDFLTATRAQLPD